MLGVLGRLGVFGKLGMLDRLLVLGILGSLGILGNGLVSSKAWKEQIELDKSQSYISRELKYK
jgi:hypothetical protein